MRITEKDVGREVLFVPSRDVGKILDVNHDFDDPIVIRWSDGNTHVYCERYLNNGDFRFADEPESKPPETVKVFFVNETKLQPGEIIGDAVMNSRVNRPDLAGQTFTYRLEKK